MAAGSKPTLTGEHGLNNKPASSMDGPRGRTDFVDPLRLEPAMPALALHIVHMWPAHQVCGTGRRAELRNERRGGDRDA
jgi:hypothetical protein